MIERAIISGVVIVIMVTAWLVFNNLHRRRARRALVTARMSSVQPSLLYFRSEHCASCESQSHHLAKLRETYGSGLAIRYIDTDRDPETADLYGVFTVPTTLIVDRTGDVRYINYGLTATDRLARQLEKLI